MNAKNFLVCFVVLAAAHGQDSADYGHVDQNLLDEIFGGDYEVEVAVLVGTCSSWEPCVRCKPQVFPWPASECISACDGFNATFRAVDEDERSRLSCSATLEENGCEFAFGVDLEQDGVMKYVGLKCPNAVNLNMPEGHYEGQTSSCDAQVTNSGYELLRPRKADGFGCLTFKAPDFRKEYKGDFACGQRNGRAVQTYGDGSFYVGEFSDGQRHGEGRMTYSNGDFYEGHWTNNTRNGFGVYEWADSGEKYVGDFKAGVAEGHGEFDEAFESEMPVYEGQFKLGKKNGDGIAKSQDGSYYKGQFEDDLYDGSGLFVDSCDDEYDGDWVKGQRHGQGKQTWFGKDITYEGPFEDGLPHGEADVTYPSGVEKRILFRNGQPVQ